MNLRETVISQLKHKETEYVPYTLTFQEESRLRLDDYYGHDDWRKRIKPYIKPVWIMDCQQKTHIDERHTVDIYGSIWEENDLIANLVKPAISNPSLDGWDLPDVSTFFRGNEKSDAGEILKKSQNSFTVIHIPWGIFEKSWSLAGGKFGKLIAGRGGVELRVVY